MLTSLEPPSPASSAGPHEAEHSLQTTPQLPESLPMTSPPQSYPEQHQDTAQSSRVTPLFKRLRMRFRKTNKNKGPQPSNQHFTGFGQLADLRFDSQAQPITHVAKTGPSIIAEGRRQRVSVFSFDRQKVCSMSDNASQRVVAVRIHPVRCSVCSLAPLFTLCDSVT